MKEICCIRAYPIFKEDVKSTNGFLVHGTDFKFTGKIKYTYPNKFSEYKLIDNTLILFEIEYKLLLKYPVLSFVPPFLTFKTTEILQKEFLEEYHFDFIPEHIIFRNDITYTCSSSS